MNVLHIDASIAGDESESRRLTARVVDRFSEAWPDLTVTGRDLAKHPLLTTCSRT
jgi:FMN-dependent NADH-azoreductase